MSHLALFYVINEYIDEEEFCKKRGLLPHKYAEQICYCSDRSTDSYVIKKVIQYISTKTGFVYDSLDRSQCYSGYSSTLMRLPKLSYEELLNIALSSRNQGERAGALGIILKDYSNNFELFLLSIKGENGLIIKDKKKIKRMVSFISSFIRLNTSYVWSLKKILSLCDELNDKMR